MARNFGKTRIGLLQFPGSNCDRDCEISLRQHFQTQVITISHHAATLPAVDAVIIPGGFSYGDYLRAGALASHAPVMSGVKKFARSGGPVFGICNGFQILCEAGLLPGALLKNAGGGFICKTVTLQFATGPTELQAELAGKQLRIPIAHGEGRYFVPPNELQALEEEGLVFCRYHGGQLDGNPNGSVASIAGVIKGRVAGMMPHPERACDAWLGGTDGLMILEAFLATVC